VILNFASWNRVVPWLRALDELRRAADSVRIPAKLNADSGEAERGFWASRTLIGAQRRPSNVSNPSWVVITASS
jgi:hypothetical protein